MLEPFEGPRLKVKRGRQHIGELSKLVEEYSARVEWRFDGVPNDGETLVTWRVSFSEQPPSEMSLILGDAAHNLRAALDIMICDVARLRGKSTDKLKFPFAHTQQKLEEMLLEREWRRLGRDVTEVILSLQPFKENGFWPLRALHDLDNLDKHRLVMPVFAGSAVQFTLVPLASLLYEGKEFQTHVGLAPDAFYRYLGGPRPHFPEGPFGGWGVVEALERSAHMVDQIVDLFAGKFGRRDGPPSPPPCSDQGSVEGI